MFPYRDNNTFLEYVWDELDSIALIRPNFSID